MSNAFNLGNTVALHRSRVVVSESYPGWRKGHLYVIGYEYGALCAVLARGEEDALDTAADNDLLSGLALDEEETARRETENAGEGIMYLGNASEPFDSIHAWCRKVEWADLDPETLADLVELGARG